ncbi:MAG TPA: M24 family metallopeptidase [Acidimicrobiia bacterium]|jgi:Xaa-Pro aminopeptidase
MDLRSTADEHDALIERRLDELIPPLMSRAGLEAWVIDAREYNEDPVARTMLPATWLGTARRRTLLVFKAHGKERGAIARYPVGPFPSVWDPTVQPDQWSALAEYLSDVTGPIGIDVSQDFALGDGLTSSEHRELARAIGEHRLRPAESLALGWLETRLLEEAPAMKTACALAHGFLRRALSGEVITPGTSSTEDVAWWLTQRAHDDGLDVWFHPGVTLQRRGTEAGSPADGIVDRVIETHDLVHIDFGIVRNGYHTDQQQHGYVMGDDEDDIPTSIVAGLRQANHVQDLLMETMVPGRTGNEVLAITLEKARAEGLRPIVYSHPIGLHGHAAGPTIGMWDNQEGIPGAGDHPLVENTGWSIELAVEIDVVEWEGQPAKIMLEEDAFLGPKGVSFLDGRQEEVWRIG